jgi:2-polyprenyl-6-methoxyphenol hydroxylase-like FAD-dependent oxidoreductase
MTTLRRMDVAIAGAGPTGLFSAIALARRGHQVTIVDRDPGPAADGSWERKGVMQFHHPHGLRQQAVDALSAEIPEVRDTLLATGAMLASLPTDGPPLPMGMLCRRSTFEQVLREAATAEPGVTFRRGHADDVLRDDDGDALRLGGRATGLLVDGEDLPADLVLNASGRNGKIGDTLRAPETGSDCGMSYVSRHYELLPGAEPGPLNNPLGLMTRFPGYLAGVFLQDQGTISVLIARQSKDRSLIDLRHEVAFDAAVRAIPGLDEWTSPTRTRPLSKVLPGVHLRNTFRGQLDEDGKVALPGLIHVGDAVCTTNPTAGRGIATSLMQAQRLVQLLSESDDLEAVTLAFDAWCAEHIRPWFADHVDWDADQMRQWAGEDIDLTRPLSSGHLTAVTEFDPSLFAIAGPYLMMLTRLDTLRSLEPRAREIYASGWRPAMPAGPSNADLAELIAPHTADS